MSISIKDQVIRNIWSRIMELSASLGITENKYNYKWITLAHYVTWDNLLLMKSDWRNNMISYYCRLSEYKPRPEQTAYYNELMIQIIDLIEQLND